MNRRRTVACAVLAAVTLGGVASIPSAHAGPSAPAPIHYMPTQANAHPSTLPVASTGVTAPTAGAAATVRGNGIDYHGGAVMTGTVKAYVIWYGAWAPASQTIVRDFLTSVGGSPYFKINTTYKNKAGVAVSGAVALGAEAVDAYSQGKTNLSDTQIKNAVQVAIGAGKLPADPNGVYFVLTSSDVTKSGFFTSYCGWHTAATIAGKDIKYSFVGDPTGPNLANCAQQTTSSPNGLPGIDAMISVLVHELEEAVTDPDLNAWYDRQGYENADKCAWTFGTTYKAANGSLANVKLGSRDYLIQRNWLNASGGKCTMTYP